MAVTSRSSAKAQGMKKPKKGKKMPAFMEKVAMPEDMPMKKGMKKGKQSMPAGKTGKRPRNKGRS